MGEVFKQNLSLLVVGLFIYIFFPIMSLKSSQLLGNATVVNIIDCQDYSIYIMFSILQLLFHFFFSLLYVSHYLFVTLLLTIF